MFARRQNYRIILKIGIYKNLEINFIYFLIIHTYVSFGCCGGRVARRGMLTEQKYMYLFECRKEIKIKKSGKEQFKITKLTENE